jgi:hypothetical protein
LVAGLQEHVVTLRDSYEAIFKDLIAELPLSTRVYQRIFRLGLLGAMNWSPTWHRPGGETLASIVRRFVESHPPRIGWRQFHLADKLGVLPQSSAQGLTGWPVTLSWLEVLDALAPSEQAW